MSPPTSIASLQTIFSRTQTNSGIVLSIPLTILGGNEKLKGLSQWYAPLSRGFDRNYFPLPPPPAQRVSTTRVPSHLHRAAWSSRLHLFLDIRTPRHVISRVSVPLNCTRSLRKLRRKEGCRKAQKKDQRGFWRQVIRFNGRFRPFPFSFFRAHDRYIAPLITLLAFAERSKERSFVCEVVLEWYEWLMGQTLYKCSDRTFDRGEDLEIYIFYYCAYCTESHY